MKTFLFTDIAELVTLDGVRRQQGRRIREKDLGILKNASFAVQNGRIIWVGTKTPKEILKLKPKKHSLRGQIVIPGLVDSHTHMVFAGERSVEFEMRNQGQSYQEIASSGGGIVSTVRDTRKATPGALLKLTQMRLENHIRQGATTVEIKSGYGLNLKDELKILKIINSLKKIRVVPTYLGPHAKPPEVSDKNEYFQSVLSDLEKIGKFTQRCDIFIEDIAFTTEQSKAYFEKAKDLNFAVLAHTNQLTASKGLQIAIENGARSVDHVNFVSDEDIQMLASSNTTCVLVPGADFYLKNPYAPARKLIDAGVRVALASNFNPGSCPSQDLQLIGALARLELKMSYYEVLAAFTIGGSYALGLEKEVGSLEVGSYADFLITETSLTGLFYAAGSSPFSSIWSGGRQIN